MTRHRSPRGHAWAVLVSCLVAASCTEDAGGVRATASAGGPKNVLFLNLEDCTASTLGCYGSAIGKTPNLDAFAETGVRFSRAYCQFPACHPSRASYFTGLRPQTSGITRNVPVSRGPLAETWTAALTANGYKRYAVGKLLHFREDQFAAFDRSRVNGPGDPGMRVYGRQCPPNDWFGESPIPEQHHPDRVIADEAIRTLGELAAQPDPFLLAVGFARPHTPLDPPSSAYAKFDTSDMPLPPGWDETRRRFNPDLFATRWPNEDEVRGALHAYYACLAFVDEQVGRVLRALDAEGLADRTIVVVTADHGFHLGDHGRWSKYTPFEPSTQVPMMIRVPGGPSAGKVCDRLVELIDLAPTLRELLGLPAAATDEGDSLVPLLADPSRAWKRAAFSYAGLFGARGPWVRTERYRYGELEGRKGATVRWLFDLERDPTEVRNVVMDPAYADVADEHARILQAGWRAARPVR